jgi:hypothetical protein
LAVFLACISVLAPGCWGTSGVRLSVANGCEAPILVVFSRQEAPREPEDQLRGEIIPAEGSADFTAVQAARDDTSYIVRVSPVEGAPLLIAEVEADTALESIHISDTACSALGTERQCTLVDDDRSAEFACE